MNCARRRGPATSHGQVVPWRSPADALGSGHPEAVWSPGQVADEADRLLAWLRGNGPERQGRAVIRSALCSYMGARSPTPGGGSGLDLWALVRACVLRQAGCGRIAVVRTRPGAPHTSRDRVRSLATQLPPGTAGTYRADLPTRKRSAGAARAIRELLRTSRRATTALRWRWQC
jgi:hypothetical protein